RTAVEAGSVDAGAATVAEEVPEGTLAALRSAQRQSRKWAEASAVEDGESPLSVSLRGSAPRASGAAEVGGTYAKRRRSNWGLIRAVGSGALAVGILTAVLALRDRPGFRVGDIEGPASSTTKRSAGSNGTPSRRVST